MGSLFRFLALLLLVAPAASAQLQLFPYFTDGTVLQRDTTVVVWGSAAAGAQVIVDLEGVRDTTSADALGAWKAELPPQASGGPFTMDVISGGTTLTLVDVYVGDVWFAAGQSNMEWRVIESDGGAAEAQNANDPLLRQFYVPKSFAAQPSNELESGTEWISATNPTDTGNFSAVAYFAAKELRAELGVPVGIIYAAFGGGQIEEWMSTAMIAGRGLSTLRDHSGAWNKMVHPLLPLPIKGVAWYQGESNATRGTPTNYYGDLLLSMVSGWRSEFGQPDMPFAWIQLPNNGAPSTVATTTRPPSTQPWVTVRAQQDRALALPHTGQVVTYDTGFPNADGKVGIHPTNKQPVGQRLALVLREIAYGQTLQTRGPRAVSAELTASDTVAVSYTDIGLGLVVPDGTLNGFSLAGANGRFEWADARIDGSRVILSSPLVPDPLQVRYAWQQNPGNPGEAGTADLRNFDGLPAVPFEAFVAPIGGALAGTYTVYGAGADYPDLASAAAALMASGVSAAVTFEIAAGVHAERIEVGAVNGTSLTNRVTFQPAAGAAVTLAPTASGAATNHVIRLDGTKHVTITGLTLEPGGTSFEDAIVLSGDVLGVHLTGNTFVADGTGADRTAIRSETGLVATDLRIASNTISGFETGIDISGDPSSLSSGVEIVGNLVTAGDGVRASGLSWPQVSGNTVTATGTGIVATSLAGAARIEDNRVIGGSGGIDISASGAAADTESLAANNMVVTEAGSAFALRIAGSSHWRLWHNTLSGGGSAALVLSGGDSVSVFNNILEASGSGLTVDVAASALAGFESGANVLASGAADLARVDGTNYATLADYVAALDALDPVGTEGVGTRRSALRFADRAASDLHLAIGSDGDPTLAVSRLSLLTTDIDGDARGATTYAGADDTGSAFFDRVVLDGPAGWRMLSLPYADLGLGGSDPSNQGGAVTPGLLEPLYTAGYPGADIDEDGTGGFGNVFLFDETENSGVANAEYDYPTSNLVTPGRGFWYYMFQDEDPFTNGEQGTFPKVLPASGTALTTDFTFPVTFTPDGTIPGANLLGNPYAEGLDWGAPGWTRTRVITTAYVFDPHLGAFGDYRQWTVGVGGTMTDGVIPVGQGFFTYATGNPAVLTAPASARTGFWTHTYGLTEPRTSGEATATKDGFAPEAMPHVRFEMTGEIAGREHTAFAAVAIAADAEIGFDARDAYALEPASGGDALRLAVALPGAGTGSAGLSVSTVPGQTEVALFAGAFASGVPAEASVRLTWEPTHLDGWIATLRDRVTGDTYSLSEAGGVSVSLSKASSLLPLKTQNRSAKTASGGLPAAQPLRLAASGGERFVVSLALASTAAEASGEWVLALGAPMPNPTRGAVRIPLSLDAAGEANVTVFDALGRRVAVLADGPLGAGAHDLAMDTAGLAPGLYIVRLNAGDSVLTRRFTVVR